MPLAETVLAVHLAIILFNLFGLVAVPLGALYDWPFVRVLWWRVLHVLLLAAVAAQAALGRACILTLWQYDLAGTAAPAAPLIAGWIGRLVYWPLPLSVFAALYALAFAYALALLWLVPPRTGAIFAIFGRRREDRGAGRSDPQAPAATRCATETRGGARKV
jgi:hypothetical protein